MPSSLKSQKQTRFVIVVTTTITKQAITISKVVIMTPTLADLFQQMISVI